MSSLPRLRYRTQLFDYTTQPSTYLQITATGTTTPYNILSHSQPSPLAFAAHHKDFTDDDLHQRKASSAKVPRLLTLPSLSKSALLTVEPKFLMEEYSVMIGSHERAKHPSIGPDRKTRSELAISLPLLTVQDMNILSRANSTKTPSLSFLSPNTACFNPHLITSYSPSLFFHTPEISISRASLDPRRYSISTYMLGNGTSLTVASEMNCIRHLVPYSSSLSFFFSSSQNITSPLTCHYLRCPPPYVFSIQSLRSFRHGP